MKKDQIVEITIEDMSTEGQGIGRAFEALPPAPGPETEDSGSAAAPDEQDRGLVVFVSGTVPGDRVKARLTKVKKNYAFGRVEEILEESPGRSGSFDC